MRLKRAILIALAILLVAGLAYRFAPFGTRPAVRSAAQAQVPVLAGTAETRSVPVYVEGLGSVQAFNTVTVKARVDGQITKVFFREGQDVQSADSLFQSYPLPFAAALQQAQANKEKDQTQLQSAQLDLDRTTKLLAQNFQSRQAYDQQ